MTKVFDAKVETWNVADITPYELNVKKHDKAQVAKIALEIQRHGFDVPIVVDKHGVIIKGHGRRLAAIELGMKTVKVIVRSDLNPDEVRAARLSDNRVAISDIDTDMLREELSTLDVDMTGVFDAKEIDYMKADLGEMDMGAFVTDMDAVLDEQRADLEERTERVTGADVRVPLSKAFGFKDVPATGQIALAAMMAKAEAATGLKDADALIAFARSMESVTNE